MIMSSNGKLYFSDIGELYYNLFLELGLGINQDQYLYDQDTGIALKCNDKYIKATFSNTPLYAGKTDIVFDPASNYKLMIFLFGYYLTMNDDIHCIAHYMDDEPGKNDIEKGKRYRQRLCIRTSTGDIYTNYYYNQYLAYIEGIFLLSGNDEYDLSNFDFIEG